MYKLHTTRAFVLKTRPIGEASRTVTLFTRELGLVEAHAQALRKLHSKLRFHLNEYAYVEVGLVRGKEKWRITSAEKIPGLEGVFENREKFRLMARMFSLLSRFIHGEERHDALFDEIEGAFRFLSAHPLSAGEMQYVEIVAILKLLYHLGYVPAEGPLAPLMRAEGWSRELLTGIAPLRRPAVIAINTAFGASQL